MNQPEARPGFLAGGGAMGARIRAFDWAATAIGAPHGWPAPLRTLTSVMLGSRQPMFVAWGPSRVLIYNDAYAPLLGGRDARALGRPFFAVWPEIATEIGALMDQVFAGDPVHMDDLALTLERNGYPEETHFAFSYTPVGTDDGEIAGLFCACTETTQTVLAERRATEVRLAAEATLRASEARFRAVAENLPGFVWAADAQGRLDYTSRQWHAFSGADPEASDGEGWGDFVHPDDAPAAFARWAQSIATRTPYETEFRLRRADGRYFWWLTRATPTIDEISGELRWMGVCTELEAIVAARETLSRSRAELERLVEERTRDRDRVWANSRDLLLVVGVDGVFKAVSPSWRTILGHAPEDVVGRHFLEFLHASDSDPSLGAFEDAAAARDLTNFENRLVGRDGELRTISWSTAVEGELVYAYGRDVTLERRQAAALQAAEEQLRQAQKMEAVGQLTGGIAHDFNNMLAVVIGSLDLLRRRTSTEDARARRHLDAASDASRRAALLTQRLLAFARRQPLSPESVDLPRLVDGVGDLLRHSIGPDVRLETALDPGLWRVHADPNQLENAILNLAVNARDAMPEGGRLTLAMANVAFAAAEVLGRPGLEPGPYVRIALGDSGLGMAPEVLAKAFDPFFTTKEVGRGTGLGLSQVYGFARQSNGHVEIVSSIGEGTTVSLYLPRDPTRDDAPHDAAPASPGAREHGARGLVLVVEDEAAVRQLSVDALGELGYRVIEADGAAAALRLLWAHPEIDLLFTDVVMPQIDGLQLVDTARQSRPELKVLLTTGYARDAVLHDRADAPNVEVLAKPFTLQELAAKVSAALAD